MIFLPKNLAALVKCASKDNTRYALQGVRVLDLGGGSYRAEATDGRVLAIVQQEALTPAVGLERYAEQLAACANGAEALVIPTEDWQEAFRMKTGKHGGEDLPVALCLGEGQFAFATPEQIRKGTPLEGRWPPTDQVIPRGGVVLKFDVGAKQLGTLLLAADSMGFERVTFLWYGGKGKVVGLVARNEHGQCFDGLVQPMSEK